MLKTWIIYNEFPPLKRRTNLQKPAHETQQKGRASVYNKSYMNKVMQTNAVELTICIFTLDFTLNTFVFSHFFPKSLSVCPVISCHKQAVDVLNVSKSTYIWIKLIWMILTVCVQKLLYTGERSPSLHKIPAARHPNIRWYNQGWEGYFKNVFRYRYYYIKPTLINFSTFIKYFHIFCDETSTYN